VCFGCHTALRLPAQPLAKALERKWDSQSIVEQRRGALLGVG
jgi:hypothetical protein